MKRLIREFARRTIEQDVDEELRFHIETLAGDFVRQGLSEAEARARTLKRFGDFERFKGQCVRIRRRSDPMQRFVKIFLILVGLLGLAVSVFSTEYRVGRIGHVLIMIAVLGRLLLYARNLRPGKTTARSLFTDQSQK